MGVGFRRCGGEGVVMAKRRVAKIVAAGAILDPSDVYKNGYKSLTLMHVGARFPIPSRAIVHDSQGALL